MKGNLYLAAILICMYLVKAQKDTTTTITTTSVSPDTTTPAPVTTTNAPITSTKTPEPAPPTPLEGTWNITDGNKTCIRADLKIRFKVTVENSTEYILLFPNATTGGSDCEFTNTTQLLRLSFENKVFLILFEKDSGGNVYARNITLVLDLPGEPEAFTTHGKFFSVKEGNSYMCKSTNHILLGNVNMEIFHIHLQAFGGTEHDFGAVEECEEDDTLNDAIPIAVACSLAGLIIIVLIAYLVGRRRSRQQGYNSV